MSTPQFNTDPLSSTQGPHLLSIPNSPLKQQKPLSSTPEISQFNTKKPSVQHPTPLQTISLVKVSLKFGLSSWNLAHRFFELFSKIWSAIFCAPPQFSTALSSTPLSVQHRPQFNTALSSTHRSVPQPLSSTHWGVWTEGSVKLRGFSCWTDGFWGLKRSGLFVLNWGDVELRGPFWSGYPWI